MDPSQGRKFIEVEMVILLLKQLGRSALRRVISLTHPVYNFDQQSASLHGLIPIVHLGVNP